MGCCGSSNRSSSPLNGSQPPRSTISQLKGSENRATPLEEESVKEVLSEIPKWKKQSMFKFEGEKPKCFERFDRENKVEKPFYRVDEISEVSEVCSLSESVSTIAEESSKRVNRSPAKTRKNRSFSGERKEGKSPARRSEQSPARRSEQSPGKRNVGSGRNVQKRDQIGNEGMKNQTRRRDAGEISGRRSRSPATRTDNGSTRSVVGRSLSAKRTNQSPGKMRAAAPESGRKMENSTMESKWPSTSNESLENPLVSLECFIFL